MIFLARDGDRISVVLASHTDGHFADGRFDLSGADHLFDQPVSDLDDGIYSDDGKFISSISDYTDSIDAKYNKPKDIRAETLIAARQLGITAGQIRFSDKLEWVAGAGDRVELRFAAVDRRSKMVTLYLGAMRARLGEDNILERSLSVLREFNEEDHPRDEDGRWTDGGGGDGGSSSDSGGGKSDADKLQAKFDKLPEVARQSEDGAREVFQTMLKNLKPDFYHESPGDVSESMRKEGIRQGYGVFAAIGKTSNFVTSPVKTVVRFSVPKKQLDIVVADGMTHAMYKGDDMGDGSKVPMDVSGEQGLMMAHPDLIGGYVSVNVDAGVPPSWIKSVEVVGKKNAQPI